ncbi:hypothetical protein THIOKS1890002 [Thiocapsa sp. KS1]|nr:hypothetical protein THIOKS1890002 [Thiocapsa sp. KS1]
MGCHTCFRFNSLNGYGLDDSPVEKRLLTNGL